MTWPSGIWLSVFALVACSSPEGAPPVDAAQPVADATVDDDAAAATTAPEFEYVDVDGAVCANGSPLGLGVSPVEGATELVVFFAGGGACWNPETCFVLNAAVHISTTYGPSVLEADLRPLVGSELVARGGPSPIADASFAFVPYCTGDLHSGTVVRNVVYDLLGNTREVHHVGRLNAELFAVELAARFPAVERVTLVGFSAGGFGAVLDADLFDEAFEQEVAVLADGSPFIAPMEYGAWRNQWQMALPDGCAECTTRFDAILEARLASGRRHGLVTTTNDEVIRAFFGYGLTDISSRVLTLVDARYAGPTTAAWVVSGSEHVLLGGYATRRHPSGVDLRSWTDAFFTGDPRFTTQIP